MPLTFLPRDVIDDGLYNPRGQMLANLSIAFACLSFLFVTARLMTRYFIQKSLGLDDFLIVPALVLALMMAVSYNEEAKNGFGFHSTQVDSKHKILAMKWFFAAQLLYKVAICFTKLSILSFYLRIFPIQNFRTATFATAAVVVAYTVGSVCATIWQCKPIPKTWNKSLPGTCIQIGDVWYSTSVMAIVTDIAIIILPVYQIRRLQLPLLQKIGLCLLFSLGIFVVACTVVRMIVVGPAITAKDTMYYQATSNSWTFLEVNVAIICASLPVLKATITRFLPGLMRDKTTGSSRYADNTSSNIAYTPRRVISHNARVMTDNASDEEFILAEVSRVRKTTDTNVTYEEATFGKANIETAEFGKEKSGIV
ncbi:uncharacterized protein K444DRAFT_589731 [Hyaloscypha bicolor E]|uniref:Integral membrane protein n=1 Tax=Hyaloscypha bicolor E TaxID=1095630 RepID=A0A2J6TAG1_9HELO|nr:uncharacterized protein K444DRAFT_589731 [Hyaloscypha bicolor E]PMD60015.1 integral membrane protein [Hyaloscypha bicolor E]